MLWVLLQRLHWKTLVNIGDSSCDKTRQAAGPAVIGANQGRGDDVTQGQAEGQLFTASPEVLYSTTY